MTQTDSISEGRGPQKSNEPSGASKRYCVTPTQGIENVWVAFATGIMGQKTKYITAKYPDGNFTLDGRPVGKLVTPVNPLEPAAAKVAQLLPATGVGGKFRSALLQLAAGANLNTLGKSTTG